MMRTLRLRMVAMAGLAALVTGATAQPGGLASAWPGLWDVSLSATGTNPQRVCVADPAYFARWEHRGATCSVNKLTERANLVTFDYRCTARGFGRSDITLLTPRSLRIRTQGILDGLPFDDTFHARWIKGCPSALNRH